MRLLILYWNELSFQDGADPNVDDEAWANRARAAFDAFHDACNYQPAVRISVAKGSFHAQHFGRSLLSWLEHWLGRDRLRRIKARAVQPLEVDEPQGHQLACEVHRDNQIGEGLTRAHLSDSWVWSLGNTAAGTDTPLIEAKKHVLDEEGDVIESQVQIANLADIEHARHWRERITVWGCEISDNCVVGDVAGNRIIMYPLDHGYPHVHVESPDFRNRTFKYRIDKFESLNDTPAQLDSVMRLWVHQHSHSLLQSWRRCSNGQHPLKVATDT